MWHLGLFTEANPCQFTLLLFYKQADFEGDFISSPKVCIFRVVFPNTDSVLVLCALSFHLQHSNINILVL